MKKKRIISIAVIVLVLVLALFAFTACNTDKTEVGEQLITNGDFESFTYNEDGKTGSFDNWKWSKDAKYSMIEVGETDSDLYPDFVDKLGAQYLQFSNTSASYAYLQQSVAVDRKSVYKFSINIRLADISKGSNSTYLGAYVGFLENVEYVFVEQKEVVAEETSGEWKELTFYVKPMNTDYLTVCLAFGGENKTVKGTAYFDNASMTRVDPSSVPSGANITEFRKTKTVRYATDAGGISFVVLLALLSVGVVVAAYVMLRRNYASDKAFLNIGETKISSVKSKNSVTTKFSVSGDWYKNVWFIAAILALGTFLIRLVALLATFGFGDEMTSIVNLAREMAGGVTDAYAGSGLAGAAPGSLYILAIIGGMGSALSNEGVSILIRMVGVIADIATVLMIYFYGRKYVGNRMSTIYAALYSVLPITFIMSGINGTFVSVLVALMLGALILLVEKKYLGTYLLMVLATILDLRAMAISPIIAIYLAYMFYKDDDRKLKVTKNRVIIVAGLLGSFVLAYILTLPVAINQIQAGQPFYGFTLLANMMTQKVIFVQNALNLYGMVGMNMKTSNSTVAILNLLFIIVLEMFAVSLYIKNRNKQEIILISSFTLAVLAVFTLKVDFTYLFLTLALGFIYTMISGDKRMYGIMGMYSVLGFLAVGQLMNNSGFVEAHAQGYFVNFETTSPDFIIFSVLTVLTTLYYAYVTYSITSNGRIKDIAPMIDKFPIAFKKGCKKFAEEVRTLKIEKKPKKADSSGNGSKE